MHLKIVGCPDENFKPYLKKAAIFKLKKTIARNKSVAIYIESESVSQFSVCEFDENGFITISSEFKKFMSVDDVDNIFRDTINPIILEVKKFLEQSGYKLNIFNSLNDENVEIKQLTYETQIAIKKPLDIQAYRGCISSVFINETNVFKGGDTINLRFKRVANYSKFTSQEAFILEKSEQGLRGDQIIDALLENFPEELDREQAMEMVRKVANDLEIERGVRKSDIKIRNKLEDKFDNLVIESIRSDSESLFSNQLRNRFAIPRGAIARNLSYLSEIYILSKLIHLILP
jgi:hypothetical protein